MSLRVPDHWAIPPQGYVWGPGQWETHANGTVRTEGQGRHTPWECTVHAGGEP